MVLLVHKLGRSIKFGSSMEDHHKKPEEALSASLRAFLTKISNFINQTLSKPEPTKCFDLINVSNRAFAHMVVEMDYPMSKWVGKAIEGYLNYSLNLLDLLNSISSSLSHLSQSRVSILHALSLIENSPSSAVNNLTRIPSKNLGKDLKLQNSIEIEDSRRGPEEERIILQALIVLKKTGVLALGFVLSGLRGDAEPYMEVRKVLRRTDDPLITGLDSRLGKEMTGGVEEVKEINGAAERLSAAIVTGRYDEHVPGLRIKLEDMGNLIKNLEKQGNDMFSEVLANRNKVLQNIRLAGKNS